MHYQAHATLYPCVSVTRNAVLHKAYANSCMHGYGYVFASKGIHTKLDFSYGLFLLTILMWYECTASTQPYLLLN